MLKIKMVQKSDIQAALDLVWSVFQEFVAPDYTEEGINEFKKFIDYASVLEKIDKNELVFWGCYHDDALLGIIATLDKTHICLLFVKRAYHRQGIARRLWQAVVDHCSNNEKITVNASPYAVGAYQRFGFHATDQEKTVHGIRFTPMECGLQGEITIFSP